MQVYSLVSSALRHSPDFSQLAPGHRTCSFISHLNFPGSKQPGCHFRRTELFEHISLHCPPGSHFLLGRESACVSKVPKGKTSEHIQRSRGSNPRSLACTSRTLPLSHGAPQRGVPIFIVVFNNTCSCYHRPKTRQWSRNSGIKWERRSRC